MTLPLWGSLEKAQDDAQTIEQAIDAAIIEHENDPTAHLGAGESLQSHKSEEIIDHPAQSLVPDKFSSSWFKFFSDFSSLDGFSAYGYNGSFFPGAYVQVVDTEAAISYIKSSMTILSGRGILTSDFVFNFTGRFLTDNATIDFSIGFFNGDAGSGIYNTGNGVYFKFTGGELYAEAKSSSQTLTSSALTVSIDSVHQYRIEYSSFDSEIYFYIDGVLVATLAIPTSFPATSVVFYSQMRGITAGYDNTFFFSGVDFSYSS